MTNQKIVLGSVNLGQFQSLSLNFILPIMLSDGRVYYFLDANGNGVGTDGAGSDPRRYQDAITHEVLDALFNNSNNTTDTQASGAVYGVDDERTALVQEYTLVLPTATELFQL